ncbi:MAG: HDOD domain-containing protein [Thermodesulfobacteriota bacterium]|nr:HDOD domain-containing protein [Thermodesulfobacteriota bacterium]
MKRLGTNEILRMLNEVGEVPTLPSIAAAVMEKTLDDNVNARQIADMVGKDQAIAAKVLKVANSAFYRRIKEISTIRGAVVVLGLNVLKSIVLSISVIDIFKNKDKNTLDLYLFWQHSLACGACAKAIAEKAFPEYTENAFMAGLLHDVGKIIADQTLCKNGEYGQVLKIMERGNMNIIEVEQEIMGIDHATLGKYLLERWNLPVILSEAAGKHHTMAISDIKSSDTTRLCAIIHVADMISNHLGLGISKDQVSFVEPALLNQLGLSSQDIQEISISLQDNISAISEDLGIPKAEPKTYFEVLQSANAKLGKLSLDLEQKKMALERRTIELSIINQMSTELQASIKLTEITKTLTTHILSMLECAKARCTIRLNPLRVMITESFWMGDTIQTRSGATGVTKELLDRTEGIFPKSTTTIFVPLKVKNKAIGMLEAVYKDDHSMQDPNQDRLLLRTIGDIGAQAIQRAVLITKNIKTQRLAAVSKAAIAANHEINSPLTTILLKIDMLLKTNPPLNEVTQSALRDIKKGSLHIKELVKKMLEISDVVETEYTRGEKMLDINKGAAQKEEASQKEKTSQDEIPGFEDYLEEIPQDKALKDQDNAPQDEVPGFEDYLEE